MLILCWSRIHFILRWQPVTIVNLWNFRALMLLDSLTEPPLHSTACEWASMRREDFSKAVKRQIHKNYNDRCVVCLEKEPVVGERGWDCSHIIAAAGHGEEQVGNDAVTFTPHQFERWRSLGWKGRTLGDSTPGISSVGCGKWDPTYVCNLDAVQWMKCY